MVTNIYNAKFPIEEQERERKEEKLLVFQDIWQREEDGGRFL